ncbi:MAG: bifunctional [glutamine synthetase] adenylyltransferase/[glutamine synthetase]-adenylyl-L-tyrosine phosphorylase [Hyphomonadaceae bacterium]|nr:bifunctional [glutamine synthetase] adenylyltransferase/[glutamine synthetase]-adenylyl-L-tyrosine phosphorylase [Hyphomonadaceae bacterium]
MTSLATVSAALAPEGGASPDPLREAARAAGAHSPYLARLMTRHAHLLKSIDADWPERTSRAAIEAAQAIALQPPALGEGMARLRNAKAALHLSVALADLARAWPLERVTGALTDFADASLRAALALAAEDLALRGDIERSEGPEGPVPGFTLIALGKMGARELNYSSDIDFSVFYEPSRLRLKKAFEPRQTALKLVQLIVKAMEEITADGYVFRTDLRLRPDPGSTPPAVTIGMAENYYQSLGQNWERCVYIKARPAAGDIALGAEFLQAIEGFVWRRHLDFAAVTDVLSIKRQIISAHKSAELSDPVFDLKLGRGGIRDIELHAQTQQLIFGGRNRLLHAPQTLPALAALARAERIGAGAAEALAEAYVFYREVEHRLQMIDDAQTQKIPPSPEARAHLAALCGIADREAWERALVARRSIVAEADHALFGRFESLADPLGSLIFTGVENDPGTLETLAKLGFSDPAQIAETIRGWHHGRVRAMRSERARELLTALTPGLLRAIAAAGEPQETFRRFSKFFADLPAGVQVLSLFRGQPKFLDEIVRALALAPRLADALGAQPALLDAMIEARFDRPLAEDRAGERRKLADEAVAGLDFERALNAARRLKREEAFRIGMQVLAGRASAQAAGAAYADLAEAMIEALAQVALEEVERVFGAQPGRFAVMALGKFGGRELSEGSDLDIMLVYDAADGAQSGGANALGAADFYARVTSRMIIALSAPTEEGALYEIDMQLRPSGSKGPVAVRLSSFERYYGEEAWTWELLALTRLRFVAGDADVGARTTQAARAAMLRPHDRAKILADVADMRARMDKERPGKSVWDLKLAPGGFVDIEFIAQAAQLVAGAAHGDALSANSGEAIARLGKAQVIPEALAQLLGEAWGLYSDLNQGLRICIRGDFDPATASEGAKSLLARLGGAADFAALEARLGALQGQVRAAFVQFVSDGSAPPAR